MNNDVKNVKRDLPSTFTLIAVMLATSARDEKEKASAKIAESIFGLNNEAINRNLDELVSQGYLTQEGSTIRMTAFGEKVCLQATQNTPNFGRLANQNANTAFAMLFAGYAALRDTHLRDQPQIVPGAGGSQLTNNLKELIEFFSNKLEPVEVAPAAEEAPKKTKTKKTTEVV